MKTEEILRYEAEFKAMQDAFRTPLLVFDFPKGQSCPVDQSMKLVGKRVRRGKQEKPISAG